MDDLLKRINKVEQQNISKLISILNAIYANVHLPSHDVNHHIRVWLHCKSMLVELQQAGLTINDTLIENALIACFFHDTGLTVNIGEEHGLQGALLFKENAHYFPTISKTSAEQIFNAIKEHDSKAIRTTPISSPLDMIKLNRLVSTADDLDALGTIGIYRYIEIYALRQTPLQELPKKVALNLRNRFANFTNTYSSLHRFADQQKERYQTTFDFFTKLDSDIASNTEAADSTISVYNFIVESLIMKKMNIESTIKEATNLFTASYPLCFFKKLSSELNVNSTFIL